MNYNWFIDFRFEIEFSVLTFFRQIELETRRKQSDHRWRKHEKLYSYTRHCWPLVSQSSTYTHLFMIYVLKLWLYNSNDVEISRNETVNMKAQSEKSKKSWNQRMNWKKKIKIYRKRWWWWSDVTRPKYILAHEWMKLKRKTQDTAMKKKTSKQTSN